jgi:hypothetical protein
MREKPCERCGESVVPIESESVRVTWPDGYEGRIAYWHHPVCPDGDPVDPFSEQRAAESFARQQAYHHQPNFHGPLPLV